MDLETETQIFCNLKALLKEKHVKPYPKQRDLYYKKSTQTHIKYYLSGYLKHKNIQVSKQQFPRWSELEEVMRKTDRESCSKLGTERMNALLASNDAKEIYTHLFAHAVLLTLGLNF